jgi:hypothetical protein
MKFQQLVFYIMIPNFFPNFPEFNSIVSLEYLEEAQDVTLGMDLLGYMLDLN